MVLLGFGVDVSESELRKSCDSTMMGTDALKAVDALRQLGFTRSRKHTLSPDELKYLVSAGHYPIVFVSLLPLNWVDDFHALVVVGITEENVTVLDPLEGERVVPFESFNLAWERRHNLAILIEREQAEFDHP
jgi:ABC-type bacteriocin/lantibiotic exporter with double-glycine peptidase domain